MSVHDSLWLMFLQANMRTDGRAWEDYRHMDVETDVVSNAAGSARLRLVSHIRNEM